MKHFLISYRISDHNPWCNNTWEGNIATTIEPAEWLCRMLALCRCVDAEHGVFDNVILLTSIEISEEHYDRLRGRLSYPDPVEIHNRTHPNEATR